MDQQLFSLVHNLAGKSQILDFFGIFFANYFPYLVALAAVLLFVAEKDMRKKFDYYATLFLSLIISRGILTEAIRFAYHRLRPFVALGFTPLVVDNSYAFPSGHATFFFALATAVWFFNKKWGWRFFAAAAIIGLARIFAGVHWPSDIVGGALIGIGSAWLAQWSLHKISAKN